MVVKKKTRKKRNLSLRTCYILSVFGFVLASFFVYFFSFDSKVHVLACQGNYYYTDQQIYEIAGIDTDTRIWLTPSMIIENHLNDQPLIKSATIEKKDNKLSLIIEEKVVIGYYIKDGKNYLLTVDNESIELEEKYLKTIVHFPLLSNFTEEQMKQIANQFKENQDVLSRQVIEKIAEMVPFETSYDDNMIKMTMQDGNIVYTSMDSLVMMANYQAMLTELHGQSVCLLLDAEHSAIDKIDCADVNKPRTEEKDSTSDETEDSEQIDENEQTEDSSLETEQESTEELDIYDQAQDWVVDETMLGLEYSASLNVYRDPNTGLKYTWNDQTQSFDQIQE